MTIPLRYPRYITAIVLFLTIVSAAQAKYSGGMGEPNDPYQIATVDDLILLGDNPEDYDKHFILIDDIDLDPNLPGRKVFDKAVIAPDTGTANYYQGTAFTGVLDGNGHMILGLTIEGADYVGLFGYLGSDGVVKYLGLMDVNITASGDSVGGLVGWNVGSVRNCYSTGMVSGTRYNGGLVGENRGSIAASYSSASVRGGLGGGLVGENVGGRIATSYSSGSGRGLVAWNSGTGIIATSFWEMQASGRTTSAGGAALTTSEMMDPYIVGLNGFANDPNWVLDAGRDYPRLAWEGTAGNTIPEPDIDWLEGSGTLDEPYRVETAEQLILLGKASILWDRHFVLGADIDLDPNLPGRNVFVQAVIRVFTGVFDGNGHTISHLTITGASYLGLFGRLGSGAQVTSLGIVDVNIVGLGSWVGGLVSENYGRIATSYSSGSVSASAYVGGLVGWNYGRIATSYSSGSVSASAYVGGTGYDVGGLVGWNSGSVAMSYSSGSVSGTGEVGGLVGRNDGGVIQCYSSGMVTGTWSVGGLVGNSYYGSAIGSFWDTQTSGLTWSNVGTAKTTAEMQTAATFFDWSVCEGAGVWTIDEGNDYPRLGWEHRPGKVLTARLSDFLAGSGSDDDPYLIYTESDIETISHFSCEQDKHFRLAFLAGGGTENDPYLIRTIDEIVLLNQCPYEQTAYYRLIFVEGEGTQENPYLIYTADQIDLLNKCPYERNAHYRLMFVDGEGTQENPYLIYTADQIGLLGKCPYEHKARYRLAFVAGEGSEDSPYLVRTADQLELMGMCPYERDAHFRLMDDIDLDPNLPGRKVFNKAVIASFTGVFDGNGHTIRHLTVIGQDFLGLFGGLGGQVRNLGVVDINITSPGSHVGGIVARNYEGTLTNCHSTGIVSGDSFVGGLVGFNGDPYGNVESGVLAQCHSACMVTGKSDVGGLVGYNMGSVTQCYITGAVSGTSNVGGLVGYNYNGNVAQCYGNGTVNGNENVGGLVGENCGTISNSYAGGHVIADSSVGGLVGVNGSIFTGWPTYHPGVISNCYSYSLCLVTGAGLTGGLLGENEDGEVTGCFWDIETSGQVTSVRGTGKTTAEMQAASTFLIWATCGNEGTWTIDDGRDYPRLSWESTKGEPIAFASSLRDLLMGEGTEESPYLIYTAEEMNLLGLFPCDWDKHFKLMADIDLSAFDGKDGRRGFNIIGDCSLGYDVLDGVYFLEGTAFTGVFDGNHNMISYLTVKSQRDCAGLFSGLGFGGHVKDLKIVDVNVTGSGDLVGAMIGYNAGGMLTHCYSSGTVGGQEQVGGLVGLNDGAVVECYSECAVSGKGRIGGLMGENYDGTVTCCNSTGVIVGDYQVGGLVGLNGSFNTGASVVYCFSTGAVYGNDYVGGLVGQNYAYGEVTQCYSTGAVSGDGNDVGGLVGATESDWGATVLESFWDTQTSGQTTSAGGTGKTTAEMKMADTFLDAGWDFVDESANGTEDIWWILEGQDYPRLWWEAHD
jgi:hypothetical protein